MEHKVLDHGEMYAILIDATQKLVDLASHHFGTDYPQHEWDVHFHRIDQDATGCEAEIRRRLFPDADDDFAVKHLRDGNIYCIGHFTKKSPEEIQQAPVSARQYLHEPS
jgi:hypothetical protein